MRFLLLALPLFLASAAHAKATPAQRCEIAKDKAAAKKYACLLAVRAKAIDGKTADAAKCSATFLKAFASAEAAAAKAGGGCPVSGDAAAIERRIDGEQEGTAQLLAGDGRFRDNGDGTITDAQSGLVWEKKSSDGSVHDQDNFYTWTSSGTASDGTLFTSFLAALNAGGGFAGHTDWRIPTLAEEQTLVDLTQAAPSVSAAFNSGCVPLCSVTTCSCTEPFFHWSSSSDRDPRYAWAEGYDVGESSSFAKTLTAVARGVRGGS